MYFYVYQHIFQDTPIQDKHKKFIKHVTVITALVLAVMPMHFFQAAEIWGP